MSVILGENEQAAREQEGVGGADPEVAAAVRLTRQMESYENLVLANVASDTSKAFEFCEIMSENFVTAMKNVKSRKTGMMVAWQMICEQLSPAEFMGKYHITDDGSFLKRSEWVLAEMMNRGWAVKWVANGEDEEKATAEFQKGSICERVSFTIELAEKKGLLRNDSNWKKDPATQLRARVSTRAATYLEPGVGAGMQDDADYYAAQTSTPPAQSPAKESGPTVGSVTGTAGGVGTANESGQERIEPTAEQTAPPKPDAETPPENTGIGSAVFPGYDTQLGSLDPKKHPRLPQKAWADCNLRTLGGLLALTDSEHLALKGVGKGSHDSTINMLQKYGQQFAAGDGDGNATGQSTEPAKTDTPEVSAGFNDLEHGAAIAEIRKKLRDAKDTEEFRTWCRSWTVKPEFGEVGKLEELDPQAAHLLLCVILAREAGRNDTQCSEAVATIIADPDSVGRIRKNIDGLKKELGNE